VHAATAAVTALSIVVSPNGDAAHMRTTLRCNPPGGTLPHAVQACARLAAFTASPFVPLPPGLACTDVYGGPETARVVGAFRGRRVWVTFRRTNGCEIARWNKVGFLFRTP
jgi:hypothetical protein